ncbi:MAG: hypothetical protein ACRCZZ_01740, partial [Phocaeicola sp.]
MIQIINDMKIGAQLLQLLTCVLFLVAVAVNKEQKLFNKDVKEIFMEQREELDTWVTREGFNPLA